MTERKRDQTMISPLITPYEVEQKKKQTLNKDPYADPHVLLKNNDKEYQYTNIESVIPNINPTLSEARHEKEHTYPTIPEEVLESESTNLYPSSNQPPKPIESLYSVLSKKKTNLSASPPPIPPKISETINSNHIYVDKKRKVDEFYDNYIDEDDGTQLGKKIK